MKLHLDRLQTSYDRYADVSDGPDTEDEDAEVRVRRKRKLEAKN